ncbi:ABC transporter transmembrane domain-containing protein [Oryzihumus sp.]
MRRRGDRAGRGDTRRTVALFRRYAGTQGRSMLFAVVLLTLEALTAVALPALIGTLINVLKDGARWQLFSWRPAAGSTIVVLAGAIVVVTAVNSLSDSMAEISLAKAGRTLGYNLRAAMFGHLQRLSLAFHLRRRTGDVLSRITSDVQALEEFVCDSVSDLLGSALLLTGTMAYLLWKSWRIALLALVVVPVLALMSNAFARRIKEASKEQRAREGDLASTAQEMLSSISVVQTYGRGDVEERKFASESSSAMAAILRTARLEALFSFTVSMLEAVVIAAVVLIGSRLVGAHVIDAGLLVAFILLIQGMFKPTRRIIKEWNTVGKIYASVERISELLERKPAVVDTPDAVEAPPLHGHIEFRDVSFAYQPIGDQDGDDAPLRTALDQVSFTIEPGEVVALVGHSGAGKSTIAQLLPRLYDPHAGAVLFDGHDIRAFTIASLRAQISMVLQETVLFTGTVADNIAYGRPGASREEVVAAAKLANAHDFVTAMPQGYDTALGERAATLSGGQRQRLAIARAFIRDTPVLVLDEPTTGLDAESTHLVGQALAGLVRGRSTVIVSHDLNLIRDVDRILVISAGRVLEEGTPADLLERGGLYADLYVRQFGQAMGVGAATADGAGRVEEFEAALDEAVPLPATVETFRRLTGRAVAPVGVALEQSDLDPLRAPALGRALPGLTEALDPDAMGPRLQSLLREPWALDWCTPGKAVVEPRAGATVRYRVGLRHVASGHTVETLVGGRVFAAPELAQRWHAATVPLVEQAAGHQDLAPFARPAALVPELSLVLHAFPVDPDLPGLVGATDVARLTRALEPGLAASLDGLGLEGCRTGVVQYARRGHAVLRHELVWRIGPTRRTVKQVVYGRVDADDRGRLVGRVATALRGHLEAAGEAAHPFLVPRLQGQAPDLGLVLLEALPGTPLLPGLVRAQHAGAPAPGPGELTVESATRASARIAATWHACGLRLGPTRTLRGDVDALREDLDAVAPLAPALAARLQTHLSAVLALGMGEGPAGFAHGDLTPSRVIFDGPMSSVVDLGHTCTADPALDVGQFVGHLAVTTRKARAVTGAGAAPTGEDPERLFLETYLATDPGGADALLARVTAYRQVSLARLALRSWCQLKPDRLGLALAALEAPLPADLRVRA